MCFVIRSATCVHYALVEIVNIWTLFSIKNGYVPVIHTDLSVCAWCVRIHSVTIEFPN
jgi:hypothetical protein